MFHRRQPVHCHDHRAIVRLNVLCEWLRKSFREPDTHDVSRTDARAKTASVAGAACVSRTTPPSGRMASFDAAQALGDATSRH